MKQVAERNLGVLKMPYFKNDFEGSIGGKKVFMLVQQKVTLYHNTCFSVPGRLFAGATMLEKKCRL